MKKLVAVAAVLGAIFSFGTSMAFAGGETGADAAHTQPYWPEEGGPNAYDQSGPVYQSPIAHSQHERNATARNFGAFDAN